MNDHQKLSAPLRGAEHYNQIEPSSNVRKTLDTTKAADLQLDLVLLVINLPDKNGRAAEQFRQRVPKSKTIFVTIESEH